MIVDGDSVRHAPQRGALAWRDAPGWPLWDSFLVATIVLLAVAVTVLSAARQHDAKQPAEIVRVAGGATPASVRRMTVGEVERVDAEYLPLVTVAPVYPTTAQQQRIEGRCVVEYRIAATGAVQRVRARSCEPQGLFEQAAIDAARQFKYRPRIRAGVPVPVEGVRNEFQFTLRQ